MPGMLVVLAALGQCTPVAAAALAGCVHAELRPSSWYLVMEYWGQWELQMLMMQLEELQLVVGFA